MSICFEKISHEECGSSDGLQVYANNDGSYTGYCWACDTYVPNPYGEGQTPELPKRPAADPRTVADVMAEIESYPTRGFRSLKEEHLNHYGVKTAVSEQDGRTPVIRFFPITKGGDVVGYKAKLLDQKKMWCHGSVKGADMFGWQQAIESGAKRLYITEGEDDAVALCQALRDYNSNPQYRDYWPAVCSIVNGAQSAGKDIAAALPQIRKHFQEVVLAFDNDEHGKVAADECAKILPGARIAELPMKDANDCVIAGRSRALATAVLFKAQEAKNTRIVYATSLYDEAKAQAEYGLSWPWAGMTRLTRGLRFGETIYLGAGVKMGKSEIVNALAKHLIIEHNLPVFMAKPEEANKKTVKLLLGKVAGKIFHDPNVEFDSDAYDEAALLVGDKLRMLNLYQHVDWNTLRVDILDAARNGAKAIFIDPITNLTNGVPSGEANTVLQGIAQDLSAIALDHELMIFIFCHLKAPESGAPHERGGKIFSNQFAGSRAMMRSCNYMIGLEGDKNEELPIEQRNIRRLVLLEDREFGEVGSVPLYWDYKTGLFNEIPQH